LDRFLRGKSFADRKSTPFIEESLADLGIFLSYYPVGGGALSGENPMDIVCPSCGEPCYTDYLRRELWKEESIPRERIPAFLERGCRFDGPRDSAREAARLEGWAFAGDSLLTITHCPACPNHAGILRAQVQADRQRRRALATMLDEDEGGLAAMLTNHS